MDYSVEKQNLIDRMCLNVERKDFILDKETATECLMKTYDLFNLSRPKKVKWVVDPFDKEFDRSAWSASSAWLALDHDFDGYVKNPDGENKPNENDTKYLEYCELLMQAKEAGAGYRVEWEDTLYIAPTPLIRVDDQNRWHSLTEPAIRWKDGSEYFYLWGVNLEKSLWKKIINKELSFKEIMGLANIEQRMVALKVAGAETMLKESDAKLLDKSSRGNELYLIENFFKSSPQAYFTKYVCPSTGRVYVSGIDPEIGKKKDADLAMAWKFGLTKQEYAELVVEA